jgi:hypothetical protein
MRAPRYDAIAFAVKTRAVTSACFGSVPLVLIDSYAEKPLIFGSAQGIPKQTVSRRLR